MCPGAGSSHDEIGVEEVPWVVGPLHYQSGQIGPDVLRSALRSRRTEVSAVLSTMYTAMAVCYF